ncbi:Ankyrin-2, partial [Durusdinium trenchii]
MEDWRDLKANALRPRLVSMDTGAEAKEWLERRLEASVTEQRDQISRRFGAFEQADKHFKDWVQREHEQLHSQLQQLRVSVQETGQQQQRLVGNLTAQSQKQDMRLQELEGQMAQSVAQVQGLMNAVSAGAMNAGNGGGTGEAAMGAAAVAASASANLEVLRQGLEREASARVALGAETAEQLKQLSDMVYELSNRQQQQQVSAQQHLQQNAAQDEKDQARVVQRVQALEPSVSSMREELEELRKLLYRCGTDCAKRCEESEELCQKRLGGVQEAALNAARELWEEHQRVVVECKSSLAALQQILDSKDKIALQLRSLQQQQREEDKQEFWTQMQVRHEQLQAKLADTERALQTEQNVRIEEQQRAEGVVSRLGLALEKAQAAWLKDSAKLSEEIHEAKRDFSIEMDGETRGVARRLADGLEAQQRSIDELGRKINGQKTELTSVAERLDSSQRAQQQELRDAEGRMMRQLNDVQTIQSGRTQQAVFDMKAEMAKLEQVTAGRCSALQKSQDELEGRAMAAVNSLETRTLEKIQDTVELERDKTRLELQRALEEERLERRNADDELRAERDRHLEQMREQAAEAKQELLEVVQTAEERLLKRLDEQVASERSKTREQIEAFIEEERSERLKAEAERLMSLQKRLQAHEELTTERLNEQRARWETEIETVRQKLEAQALRDKQDLQKDLQEFVQEERLVTNALTEEMTTLAGDMQSLADSWQKHQRATEQRLATEFAALAAQQAVSSAALTAQLGRSEEAQKQRHLDDQMIGGVLAIGHEGMDPEHSKEVAQRFDELKAASEADKASAAAARADDRKAQEEHSKEVAQRFDELKATSEAEKASAAAARADDRKAQEEQNQALTEALEKETQRAREAEGSLLRITEGLAAQLAHQNGEQLALIEKTKEHEKAVAQHFEELKAASEADKASAASALAEDRKAQEEREKEREKEVAQRLEELKATTEAEKAAAAAARADDRKAQEAALAEISKSAEAKMLEERTRAMECEAALREGLAAQTSEHKALVEKTQEHEKAVAKRFEELQTASEADKASAAAARAEDQKAHEATTASMQEMMAEMSKNAEAKVQEERTRAMECEAALREGLAAQTSEHKALVEKTKEHEKEVEQRVQELKATSEASAATARADDQKALEAALAEISKSAEATTASMQEKMAEMAEMSKSVEAKMQEERNRAMEYESALREGLAQQTTEHKALVEKTKEHEKEVAQRFEEIKTASEASVRTARADDKKAQEAALAELSKAAEAKMLEERTRAMEYESALREGLAAQNKEHKDLVEKTKEHEKQVSQRFEELKSNNEADKASAAAARADDRKAQEAALAEMSKSIQVTTSSMHEMMAEMSKSAEAKLQEEKSRAMENETALREGLAAQA